MANEDLIVNIEWVDSHYEAGWSTCDAETDGKLLTCRSVGWIRYEDDDVVVIVSHVTNEQDQQFCGAMTIPKCAIRKRSDHK